MKALSPTHKTMLSYSMPLFVIAAYITLFGQGVTRALNALFNGLPEDGILWNLNAANPWNIFGGLIAGLLIVAAGFWVYSRLNDQPMSKTLEEAGLAHPFKLAPSSWLLAGFGFYLSMLAAAFVASFLPQSAFTEASVNAYSGNVFAMAGYSMLAGVREEIMLVPFTIMLLSGFKPLQGKKWALPLIIAIAVAFRVAFHLYYGIGGLVFGIWALGVIYFWYKTRNTWAAIIAHATFNAFNTLNTVYPAFGFIQILLVLGSVAVVITLLSNGGKTLRTA